MISQQKREISPIFGEFYHLFSSHFDMRPPAKGEVTEGAGDLTTGLKNWGWLGDGANGIGFITY